MADKTEGTTEFPLIFTNRVETILVAFYKVFFSQERLFANIINEFVYSDGSNGLVINSADDRDIETINSFPALVIQPGPWSVEVESIDQRNDHMFGSTNDKVTHVRSSFSVTAVTSNVGSCEVLIGLATLALLFFDRALKEEGFEDITKPSGGPATKISQPSDDQKFAATFSFTVKQRLDWIEKGIAPPEEKISVAQRVNVEGTNEAEVTRTVTINQPTS